MVHTAGSKNTKYWFKRRRFGYGWTPVTWQGWVAVVVFLAVIAADVTFIATVPNTTEATWFYLIILVAAIAGLVIVSALTSPAPKWRWGKSVKDNKKEDF